MAIVLIRTIVLYFLVLLTFRIMGKSELSEMSPFQLVVVFMIAELAAIPIESPSVPLFNGIAAIFALMFLQTMISTISVKSEWFKNFINGRPSILIENGEINQKELSSLRITLNDLLEQLRIKNIPVLSDVEYAVMESNGELSVIPKSDKKPLTVSSLKAPERNNYLPLVIISDGVIYKTNLEKVGIDEKKLDEILKKHRINSHKNVFLAFTDEELLLHIYISEHNREKAKEIAVCEIS